MGSLGAMAQRHGSSDRYFQDGMTSLEKLVPEGIEGRVPYKGSLVGMCEPVNRRFAFRHGYTGCADIETMRTKPEFCTYHQFWCARKSCA